MSFLELKRKIEVSLRDETKPWTKLFDILEEKTKVDRVYLFLFAVVFLAVYLVIGYAAQLVCNVVAFLYPAYASIKAIESPRTEDDKKWLIYWTVFAFFCLLDYPCQFLLHWIPFYWLIKCVFLVWLFLPFDYNGSNILYNNFIKPQFLKHQGEVDTIIENIADLAGKGVKYAAEVSKDK